MTYRFATCPCSRFIPPRAAERLEVEGNHLHGRLGSRISDRLEHLRFDPRIAFAAELQFDESPAPPLLYPLQSFIEGWNSLAGVLGPGASGKAAIEPRARIEPAKGRERVRADQAGSVRRPLQPRVVDDHGDAVGGKVH